MRRSLVYFICPIAGNGVWQWNVEQLKQRLPLFDGRKVVAVAQGGLPISKPRMRAEYLPLDHIDKVRAMLPNDCEVFEVVNNPILGEVVAWRQLWDRVLTGSDDDDVVFYGHAKGVKRGFHHPTAIQWATAMYETNLDYWPLVERLLETYPTVGSFKKVGWCFPNTNSSWHYSGSFGWFRAKDFAARNWKNVPQMWAGTEALPGIIYRPEESGCLFHEGPANQIELYNAGLWAIVVTPALEVWKAQYAEYKVLPVPA